MSLAGFLHQETKVIQPLSLDMKIRTISTKSFFSGLLLSQTILHSNCAKKAWKKIWVMVFLSLSFHSFIWRILKALWWYFLASFKNDTIKKKTKAKFWHSQHFLFNRQYSRYNWNNDDQALKNILLKHHYSRKSRGTLINKSPLVPSIFLSKCLTHGIIIAKV